MKRVVAGMLRRGDAPPTQTRARVESALAGFGRFEVLEDGPLTVGWTTGAEDPSPVADDCLCVLDGTIFNLPAILGEAGLDAGTQPGRGVEGLLALAYRRLGEALLPLLRGSFCLLFWDRRSGTGLVARDQMGGGLVACSAAPGGFAFASEVRHVLDLLPSLPTPDRTALAHWIGRSGQAGGRTFYDGLWRLPAAHLLPLAETPGQPRAYWEPRYHAPLNGPREELLALLRDALYEGVRRRCPPDETTGVLLSGGLDSSVVTALGATGGASRLAAYSAVFPEHPKTDESRYVDLVTSEFDVDSTRIAVRGGSVLGGALSYMARWSLPPVSPNMFFWEPLFRRAAADGVRVMLAGEGGDELFGFSPYLLADRLRRGRLLSAMALTRRFPGRGSARATRSDRQLVREYGFKGAAPPWFHNVARRVRGASRYAPVPMRAETARLWLDTDESFGWKRLSGPRWWAYLVNAAVQGSAVDLLCDQSRRRARIAGLDEERHPLVDVDVVELVLRLPPELAFDPNRSRPLLRDCVRGLVPDEILARTRKTNFDAVFQAGLARLDLPLVHRLLGDSRAEVGEYVELPAVRERFVDVPPPSHPGELRQWTVSAWRLLTAELWLRTHADNGFGARLADDGLLTPPDYEFVSGAAA